MICDSCGMFNGHAYYCPDIDKAIQLPIGLKPSRYIPELADWLRQVQKVIKAKKEENNDG